MSNNKMKNVLYGTGIVASTAVAGVAIWNLINNQPDWEKIEKSRTDTLATIVHTINKDNIQARKDMSNNNAQNTKVLLEAIQQNKPVDNSAQYIETITKIMETSDEKYEKMMSRFQEANAARDQQMNQKISKLEDMLKQKQQAPAPVQTQPEIISGQGYSELNLMPGRAYDVRVDKKSCSDYAKLAGHISPAVLYFLEKHNDEFTLTRSVDRSENFANDLYVVDKKGNIVGWLGGENLQDENKNNDNYNAMGFSSEHSEEAIEFEGYVNGIQLNPKVIKYLAKREQARMRDLVDKINRLTLKSFANGKSTHVSSNPVNRISASFNGYVKEIDANGQAVWYQKCPWSRGVNTVGNGISFIPDGISYGTESLDDLAAGIENPTARNLTRIPTVIIDNAIGGTCDTVSAIVEYTSSLLGDAPLDSINPEWNYTKVTDKNLIAKLEEEYNHVVGYGHNYQSKNIAGSSIKAYYVGKKVTPIVLGIVGLANDSSNSDGDSYSSGNNEAAPPAQAGGDITGGGEFGN